jgi:hypothetical protein
MNREQIIHDMCMTYRHDYGLEKDPDGPSWVAGMTQEERQGLFNTMSQIYDNNIQPMMEIYQRLVNGDEVVLPKDKDHAESMVRVGMFYLSQKNGKSE